MNKAITFFTCYFHEVSVVLNVLSSHSNTNLLFNRFLHKQFLVSKYSSILHALLH